MGSDAQDTSNTPATVVVTPTPAKTTAHSKRVSMIDGVPAVGGVPLVTPNPQRQMGSALSRSDGSGLRAFTRGSSMQNVYHPRPFKVVAQRAPLQRPCEEEEEEESDEECDHGEKACRELSRIVWRSSSSLLRPAPFGAPVGAGPRRVSSAEPTRQNMNADSDDGNNNNGTVSDDSEIVGVEDAYSNAGNPSTTNNDRKTSMFGDPHCAPSRPVGANANARRKSSAATFNVHELARERNMVQVANSNASTASSSSGLMYSNDGTHGSAMSVSQDGSSASSLCSSPMSDGTPCVVDSQSSSSPPLRPGVSRAESEQELPTTMHDDDSCCKTTSEEQALARMSASSPLSILVPSSPAHGESTSTGASVVVPASESDVAHIDRLGSETVPIESDDRFGPTPPIRAQNPMTRNSPFVREEFGTSVGAELGLLAFSPPPSNLVGNGVLLDRALPHDYQDSCNAIGHDDRLRSSHDGGATVVGAWFTDAQSDLQPSLNFDAVVHPTEVYNNSNISNGSSTSVLFGLPDSTTSSPATAPDQPATVISSNRRSSNRDRSVSPGGPSKLNCTYHGDQQYSSEEDSDYEGSEGDYDSEGDSEPEYVAVDRPVARPITSHHRRGYSDTILCNQYQSDIIPMVAPLQWSKNQPGSSTSPAISSFV